MSRTFSTKSGSLESLKPRVRCGCTPNSRKYRCRGQHDTRAPHQPMRRRPRTHAFRQALTLNFCERNFPVSRPPHLLSPILCAANSMNRPVTQYKLFMGHDTSIHNARMEETMPLAPEQPPGITLRCTPLSRPPD